MENNTLLYILLSNSYLITKIFNLLDRQTALSLLCTSKQISQYNHCVNHVKKISVGDRFVGVLTYSGKIFFYNIKTKIWVAFAHNNGNLFRKVICGSSHISGINSHGVILSQGLELMPEIKCEAGFRSVSYSNFTTAALTMTGELKIWSNPRIVFPKIPTESETFRKIKCGWFCITAITSSGEFVKWGNSHPNPFEQLSTDTCKICKFDDMSGRISALTDDGKVMRFYYGTCKIISENKHVDVKTHRSFVTAINSSGEIYVCGDYNNFYLPLIHPDKYCKISSCDTNFIALTRLGKIILWDSGFQQCGEYREIIHEGVFGETEGYDRYMGWR